MVQGGKMDSGRWLGVWEYFSFKGEARKKQNIYEKKEKAEAECRNDKH
uniref:Uncharacterized protein n=1 Tax=Nelumbo nucifera TaxID=4432 RepID=A0A822ZX17_NELNU|nr:TPA_asm: hypothetical protein HUJ06_018967 [Nelumbo nucifera]